jgi:hypothetical protein
MRDHGPVDLPSGRRRYIKGTGAAEDGTFVAVRPIFNFIGASVTDNPGNNRVDIEFLGSGGGGGAPDDAEYLVGASDGDLTAERVVTDTPTVTWDLGTAGQAKANVVNGGVLASPDGEYHPDIPPASMFASESWAGGVADQTWAWANQGSASEVLERDGAKIINPISTQSWAVRYADMLPSTGDFTAAAKMSCGYWNEDTASGVAASLGGLLVVTGGTITSPTQIYSVAESTPGSASSSVFAVRGTNYTTGAAATAAFGNAPGMFWHHFYVMIQWDDGASGDARLLFFTSGNGMDWHKRTANSLSGAVAGRPVDDLGWFAKAVSTRLEWIRVFDLLTFDVGNRP